MIATQYIENINLVVLHCSASDLVGDDNIEAIARLHTLPKNVDVRWGEYATRGKGFDAVGYHFFIDSKGNLFKGRDLDMVGAHCYGHNRNSLSICFSGNSVFTKAQFETFVNLRKDLDNIVGKTLAYFGHNRFNKLKSCPNFDIGEELEKHKLV